MTDKKVKVEAAPKAEYVNPMTDDAAAKALAVNVAESKPESINDAINSVIAESELDGDKATILRRETRAFFENIEGAAGEMQSALSHLVAVKSQVPEAFESWRKHVIATRRISASNFSVLEHKAEALNTAEEDAKMQTALLSQQGGDSMIVRYALSKGERDAYRESHPGTKPPKATWKPSKYFLRAVSIVERPHSITKPSADEWAGQVVRLASQLRAKDRTGKEENGSRGDVKKAERFETRLDNLLLLITGDDEHKGAIVLSDANAQNGLFCDAAEAVLVAVLTRLPAKVVETLNNSLDDCFEQAREKMSKAEKTPAAA